jgi:hypothetical protein
VSQPAVVLTGCLEPIDKGGLEKLIESGKANPKAIKTLKCKTVAEGRFRHLNYHLTLLMSRQRFSAMIRRPIHQRRHLRR